MNQTIWYCMEDAHIFPNVDEAMKDYKKWLEEHNSIDNFDEETFYKCYKEFTFAEYNELID